MKKFILTLALLATLGSMISCSTDDSALEASGEVISPIDNGDKDLPKPPLRP